MPDKLIRIAHLYPRRMSIYGDRGNIVTLTRRLGWRGLESVMEEIEIGDALTAGRYDLFFFGGGQDQEQDRVAADLQRHRRAILTSVEEGAALLAVCGGYQLLGHYYQPADGPRLEGIGLFDAHTEAGPERLIGNVVAESKLQNEPLVGFENHSGLTFLAAGANPLGEVRVGHGNNGRDHTEGVVYQHAVGTYLHGALLPKNPGLADWLLAAAVKRRYPEVDLAPLSDTLEQAASAKMVQRLT